MMPQLRLRKSDARIVLALVADDYCDKKKLARLAQVRMKHVDRVLYQLIANAMVITFGQGTMPDGTPYPKLYQLTAQGRAWAHSLLGMPQPHISDIDRLRMAVELYDHVAETGEIPDDRQPIRELANAAKQVLDRWWR